MEDSESLLKAYTNLTSGSYLMLFIQSYLERRVEIREITGKINPMIIHPRAQVHFGLALKDNSSLIFVANILGTNDTVYLNQHEKVRIQPENDIYKQAHIVLAANSHNQADKLSPYKTQYGGENRFNMSSQIQSQLGNRESKENQPKEIVLTISFRNMVGAVAEISEITGAVEPILLLPYEMKTIRLVVKKSWPLIFHASSDRNVGELQVNGQRQLRVYLPLEINAIKEMIITSRNRDSPAIEEAMAIMLSINNTLRKPVALFDVSNTMRPLVVPETRVCRVGFFVKNASYVILSGLTIGGNSTTVALNGELKVAVQSSQNPEQQNLIVIKEPSKTFESNNTNYNSINEMEIQNASNATSDESHSNNVSTGSLSSHEERFVMLSIHNTLDFGVKFIELTGAHKPFVVLSHSDTRLGFSVMHKGPIVLKAMHTDSKEDVLLNNQNSLHIKPSADAISLTEIIVSEKSNGNVVGKRQVRPSLSQLILMHK